MKYKSNDTFIDAIQWTGEYDKSGRYIEYYDNEYSNEYDEKGNCIYCKYADGYERWYEYDENGNLIHYKNSDGYERWYEYDKNGNCVHVIEPYEEWYEYDDDGNIIHYKDTNGDEDWYAFDVSKMDYSEFSQFVMNHDIDPIVVYDDFEIYLIDHKYYFYECVTEASSDEFFEIELIAELSYDVNNDVKCDNETLISMFDCDCCGEMVTDDEIKYMWFKKVENKIEGDAVETSNM